MENLKLPSSLTEIGTSAFANCENLKIIDTSKNTNFLYENGSLLKSDRSEIIFVSKSSVGSTFIIPDGMKKFTTNILLYDNIKKLVIPSELEELSISALPSSIEEIEIKPGNENIFLGDKIIYNKDNKLMLCFDKNENVVLKEGITTIGENSLKCAVNAKNITLPSTVVKIDAYAGNLLPSIQNINIKESVSEIDPLAFCHIGCNINIDEKNENYVVENNILYKKNNNKKETLVSILYNIDGTIEIDKEVKKIGDYAFYEQKKLTELVIPDGVEEIGESAFHACHILKRVEIPKTVKKITNSFNTAPMLEEILIHNVEGSISGEPWGASRGEKIIKWE